jgi:hypothetical protein
MQAVDQAGTSESQALSLIRQNLEGAKDPQISSRNTREGNHDRQRKLLESEAFVRPVVQKNSFDLFVLVERSRCVCIFASRRNEEFRQDVTVRLQSRRTPLHPELQKIEPRSIGVGQTPQRRLEEAEACLKAPSAPANCEDLNTASRFAKISPDQCACGRPDRSPQQSGGFVANRLREIKASATRPSSRRGFFDQDGRNAGSNRRSSGRIRLSRRSPLTGASVGADRQSGSGVNATDFASSSRASHYRYP